MSLIHRRRQSMGTSYKDLPDPYSYSSPSQGESITHSIPDTDAGINFEIARMGKYVQDFRANPLVVKTARNVVSLCNAKDKKCEMNALFLWTKNNFRYVNDPVLAEAIATPVQQLGSLMSPPSLLEAILGDALIRQMDSFGVGQSLLEPPNQIASTPCFDRKQIVRNRVSGDCDEGAIFLGTLLAAVGIVPRFRFGGQKTSDGKCNYHHVWLQGADDQGKWYDMDVTEDDSKLGWFHKDFNCFGHADIF